MNELPNPECNMGYTNKQVAEIMGDQLANFQEWSIGCTRSICEGRKYNHETSKYEPDSCGPHGVVTYRIDVDHFLSGLQPFD